MRLTRVMSRLFALAVGACGLIGSSLGWAESADQVPLGARAIGMGGAFSAIADDATAPFWNPAGLPWIGHQEIAGHHANLFNSGIKDDYAAFVLPLSPQHALAVDWYRSGFRDTELDFGENRIDLAYGLKVTPFLSAGVTAKYLSRNTALDGVAVRRGQGVGADLGLILVPLDRMRLALTLQDAFDTKLAYSIGQGTVIAYPRSLRLGAAYRVLKDATIALDLDGRYHLGAEYQVVPQLALRAGVQEDPDAQDGLTTSFGAGIAYGVFRFDYAREDHPVLGSTNHFGVSMGFNFNPSRIRIEKVEARAIFSSLYKTYAREPFGTIYLRNLHDEGISATVETFVQGMMSSPSSQVVTVPPKSVQPIELTAVFDEQVMGYRSGRQAQVEISATYESRRLPRTEKASADFLAYAPGNIDWSAGVAQAAAFVTMNDPAVDAVATHAVRIASGKDVAPGLQNITKAAAIFDALGAMGITYVSDANSPFTKDSPTPRAVDTVRYPRETLARRAGDCDDTTVLYAALLESVGISTQLVDVPGHVFLLVDTGVHEQNRLSLVLDSSRTVVSDEHVWVPVETTMLKDGFAKAWDFASESYARWKARGEVRLANVSESQATYEPAELRGNPPRVPEPEASVMLAQLDQDLAAIRGWRDAYHAERYGAAELQITVNAAAVNEIARIHYLAGRFDEARTRLEQALVAEDRPARTHNNLANVLAANGDRDGALSHYDAAIAADDTDAGTWLNLGLTEYAFGDTSSALEHLAQGIALSGGYEEACRLLSIDPEARGGRQGEPRMSAEEARRMLQAALRKVPPAASRDSSRVTPARGPRKLPAIATAGGKGEYAALRNLLYWKP